MVKLPAVLCAAILLASPTTVLAATESAANELAAAPPEVRRNATLVDADGKTLGKVYEVNAGKGVVTFMAKMKVYQLPIDTLSSDGAKIRTTLTRSQIGL